MKHIFLACCLSISFSTYADIVELNGMNTEPTAMEVTINRSCFNQLEELGCGHPKSDHEHFRTCMSQVFNSLDASCKIIMRKLYGE